MKPCPFCGGEPQVRSIPGDRDGPVSSYVWCLECHAKGPYSDGLQFCRVNEGVPHNLEDKVMIRARLMWERRSPE